MLHRKRFFLIVLFLWTIPSSNFAQKPDGENQKVNILFSDFLNSEENVYTVAVENSQRFYGFFKIIKCLYGNLYFSGNGFPSVVYIKYNGKVEELETYFERLVVGSKLTLEKCAILRDGGLKPLIINKTILFQ